ncbi:MAG TPA: tricarballylate utilization 4Fe-4S protein TcuB [Candidatus Sulfotelmatobacter sp.]|nr:tricarballylate utilization 4Fe-4S protein TcuB [Candidatus Sulfotelmatobacter sp.]
MLELDLTTELDRQLLVCNACRYCEGFCAMFGAAQLRTAIGDGDLAYLSSLCHDCRMCFDACMFTPPHDYAVNIPAIMAQARVQTYARYARPAVLGALLRSPARTAVLAVAAGIAIVLCAVLLASGATALWTPALGPGAFYRVLPYTVMVTGATALVLAGAFALVVAGRAYARDIGGGAPFVRGSTLRTALREALALTYLRGGGVGCYDEGRGSSRRRIFHGLVFWGVTANFAATTLAAIGQEFLHRVPPYPLWSPPVALGALGGIALAIGAAGLFVVKRRSDPAPTAARQLALDDAFLVLLELAALSGLALLALRTTPAMGTLLIVHLGTIVGLFTTAPYGKLVHAMYRSIALVKHAAEREATPHGPNTDT